MSAQPLTKTQVILKFTQHDRDSAGRVYVYPVLSRRAGGISLGVNLNINNACNWACIYCQVEGLTRGGPNPVDLNRLAEEFRSLLAEILAGDVFTADAPLDQRKLVDVAFSGNGEPTSAKEFPQAVALIYQILDELVPDHSLPVRLITNGSLMHRRSAREGVAMIGQRQGEVWFKLDRCLVDSARLVNGVPFDGDKVSRRLLMCAKLAPTWIQTCWLAIDGQAPGEDDQQTYLSLLKRMQQLGADFKGVLLYGMARASASPKAARLSRLPSAVLERFAVRIQKETGLSVQVSP